MLQYAKTIIARTVFLTLRSTRRKLRIIQKLDGENIQERIQYQQQKLFHLLHFSASDVPYYKNLIQIDKIRNSHDVISAIQELPILTKEDIRENFNDLQCRRGKSKQYFNTSGGSTGEPVQFIQDKEYSDWNIANKLYYKTWAGQQVGDRELRFWGSERDLLEGKEKLSIRLRNWIYNRKEFNTFRMTESDMHRYAQDWNAYKPQWVESYVQSAFEFAKFADENGYSLYSPRGVLTSAGTLYAEMEQVMSRVFGCPIYNRYGSREVGDIACSDQSGRGLRLSLWNHYVELVDGRILVTTLNNFSMPLIRYDIGDIGELSEDGLYLTKVQGRVNSVIRTRTKRVDSAAITSMFYYRPDGSLFRSFQKYQLVQKTRSQARLMICVADKGLWQDEKKELADLFDRVFSNELTVDFIEVDDIPPLPSGKYQYVISEVE